MIYHLNYKKEENKGILYASSFTYFAFLVHLEHLEILHISILKHVPLLQ